MSRHANMWRITDDFWDTWPLLRNMFDRCELWQRHVGDGNWPDCDMLPLGCVGRGFGEERTTRFTREEQRAMMHLWCIFRSPLMLGADLTQLDAWTLSLLTNHHLLRVQQYGTQPVRLSRDAHSVVWMNRAEDDQLYVALFNLSDETRPVCADLSFALSLGMSEIRDIWTADAPPAMLTAAEPTLMVNLPPHASAMFVLNSTKSTHC